MKIMKILLLKLIAPSTLIICLLFTLTFFNLLGNVRADEYYLLPISGDIVDTPYGKKILGFPQGSGSCLKYGVDWSSYTNGPNYSETYVSWSNLRISPSYYTEVWDSTCPTGNTWALTLIFPYIATAAPDAPTTWPIETPKNSGPPNC